MAAPADSISGARKVAGAKVCLPSPACRSRWLGDANFLPIIAQTKARSRAPPRTLAPSCCRLAEGETDARKSRAFHRRKPHLRLARVLARVGYMLPNMVTVAGTRCDGRDRGVCIPQGWIWRGGIALAVIMFGDSVDGTLARMTTGGALAGAFLDSTLDRLGDRPFFRFSHRLRGLSDEDDSIVRTWAIIAGICSVVGAAAVPYARPRRVRQSWPSWGSPSEPTALLSVWSAAGADEPPACRSGVAIG